MIDATAETWFAVDDVRKIDVDAVFRGASLFPPGFVSALRREAVSVCVIWLRAVIVAGPYQAPAHPNPKPPANAAATSQMVRLGSRLGVNSAMTSSRWGVEKSH
jgi:hypothetical protein